MTLTRVRGKGQITLPDDVRRAAHVAEGDYLEVTLSGGAIVMRPKRLVDADQAWFWTKDWQRGEQEASDDIAARRTKSFESADEFLSSLDE
jgi:AbrB family looped-hinge helix DNA binding protein